MIDAYNFKVAFGCWINDMRNKPMPRADWPYVVLDDQAENDIVKCLELQRQSGFNIFDVAGLFVSHSWPIEVEKTVSEERRQRLKRIITEAHSRGIKITSTLGVYSWGFDDIIKNNIGTQGPNPHAMCGSSEESWYWMKRVIDYILSNFEIDGFHLESSDLGRCTCSRCSSMGDTEYHCVINKKVAEYVKSRWPEKIVFLNMCGYTRWGLKIPTDEFKYLEELGRHLDFIIDNGNFDHYIDEKHRPDFIKSLKCGFGTSGGVWVYPPQRWDRLRWFLPYTKRSGMHIKSLYEGGGRAMEYYMGPVVNPGVEVNILFGGLLLSNVSRSVDDVLYEVIERLYGPVDSETCKKLAGIFQRAEDAYFENRLFPPSKLEGNSFAESYDSKVKMFKPSYAESFNGDVKIRREAQVTPLLGTEPGPAEYLCEYDCYGFPMMNTEGRKAYKRELLLLLDEIEALESRVSEIKKLERIKICITNVLTDIETIEWVISPKPFI